MLNATHHIAMAKNARKIPREGMISSQLIEAAVFGGRRHPPPVYLATDRGRPDQIGVAPGELDAATIGIAPAMPRADFSGGRGCG
jgi:hypothetical protein